MVIGAGIAGLLAARVLADVYGQVTVVDRDALPGQATARGGVPQGRHVHALLFGGLEIIEDLLPGLTDELVTAGVPTGDVLADARAYFNGYRLIGAPSGLPGLSVTRPRLEHNIRIRVAELPNVTVVGGCAVSGLRASADGIRIVGVDLDSRTNTGHPAVLDADLVIDASGRNSQTPQWLAALGYPQPREDRVAINIGYASCPVTLPRDVLDGHLGIAIGSTVEIPRGGSLQLTEDDRWLVSLAGYRGAHPPVEPDRFLEFARSLPVPDIYLALRRGSPLAQPVRFRVPYAIRRRYERLRRFPSGLLVIGDAGCSFNPVYGQGMSVAARQTAVLRDELSRPTPSLQRIRRRLARAAGVAWVMSVTGDLKMPQVVGRRTAVVRLTNRYTERMFRAAQRDPIVARTFMRVANLVAGPTELIRPGVLGRVIRGSRRHNADEPGHTGTASSASVPATWHRDRCPQTGDGWTT